MKEIILNSDIYQGVGHEQGKLSITDEAYEKLTAIIKSYIEKNVNPPEIAIDYITNSKGEMNEFSFRFVESISAFESKVNLEPIEEWLPGE